MIKLPMLNSSQGRLDTGGKQMGSTEYLFGGALGIVILGSLTLMILNITSGGKPTGELTTQYYWCDTDSQFTVDPKVNPMKDPNYRPPDPNDAFPTAICPKCHQKGWMMYKCPKCGKLYTPDKSLRNIQTYSPEKDVCPECKTNRNEWYKTHPK